MKVFSVERNSFTKTFKSGQFVSIGVKINNNIERRSYSLVSIDSEKDISFMVKKIPNGLVSSYLHDNIKENDSLLLGEVCGNFVLDESNKNLLLLSGGSGITPVMSMLRDIKNKNIDCNLVFLHAAKSYNDIPFKSEFEELQKDKRFKFIFLIEDMHGRPNPNALKELVPDILDRLTFMCGPTGMLDSISNLWQNNESKLIVERFTLSLPKDSSSQKFKLYLNHKEIYINKSETILSSLEKEGIYHPSSCRAGLCNMCSCKKISGITKDISNTLVSHKSEDIKVCVSIPESDIKLNI